jgi:hypothetical protein
VTSVVVRAIERDRLLKMAVTANSINSIIGNTVTLDQARALPDSLSPIIAATGAVMNGL